jgi:hypothetical protein
VRDSGDLRAESAPSQPRTPSIWARAAERGMVGKSIFLRRRRVSLRLRRYKLSCINNHDVTHGYTLPIYLLWIDRRTHKLCAMHSKVGVPRRNKMHAVRRRGKLNQGVKLGSGARAENQRCVRQRARTNLEQETFGFEENRKRS